ncbi:hypothetical protein CEXT_807221 [Caerostris extrusa]|uniref:Uncharacterized protein n=1 Tax=Caerostris extrusa TaxID=172846 RepID=A0AAV4RYH5_CAEEX|nr:hypothetical protein CEXT_807221 [Caerostris extrusa]
MSIRNCYMWLSFCTSHLTIRQVQIKRSESFKRRNSGYFRWNGPREQSPSRGTLSLCHEAMILRLLYYNSNGVKRSTHGFSTSNTSKRLRLGGRQTTTERQGHLSRALWEHNLQTWIRVPKESVPLPSMEEFLRGKDTSRCGAWTSANRKPIYPVALKQADGTFTRASLRLPFTHTCQG